MKIVVPLSNIDHYEPLVESGADEFFCGIVPHEWLRTYKQVLPINRREFMIGYNSVSSMTSMKTISKAVERYGIPVKITFNTHYYIQEQYPMMLELIKELMDIGFHTFIFADVAFIVYLREKGINCSIHVSGEVEILNRYTMEFLDRFDVDRFIFPRKITISDIKNCISHCKLENKEYEAFILNELCIYCGAFCNTIHCSSLPNACHIPNKLITVNPDTNKFFAQNKPPIPIMPKLSTKLTSLKNSIQIKKEENGRLGASGCGICHIRELMEAGVTHLKIVGRGKSIESLSRDISTVRDLIEQAKIIQDKEAFATFTKEKYLSNKCHGECYYAEE